jgi:hypothetical protein
MLKGEGRFGLSLFVAVFAVPVELQMQAIWNKNMPLNLTNDPSSTAIYEIISLDYVNVLSA